MKGEPLVIDYLNKALRHELTAVHQYWVHARLLADWGFGKLADKELAEAEEERQHAQDLMDRIGSVMPVVPFPVIAHAMACGIRSQAGLLPAIEDRFERALAAGAPVFLPKRDLDYTIEAALKTLSDILGGTYLPMPRADAKRLSGAVSAALGD